MSESSRPTRLYELLADRALVGLSADEEAELKALLAANPNEDPQSFDRAAAAAQLSLMGGKIESMPAHVAAKIEAAAFANRGPKQTVLVPQLHHQQFPPAGQPPQLALGLARSERRSDPLRWAGWIAAAACLAIAVGVSVLRKPQIQTVAIVTPPPSTTVTATPIASVTPTPRTQTPEQLRAQLLAESSSVKIDWSPTKDPAGVGASGDVVFSVAEQRGYMRFHGLAQNDPTAHQYQLWIFDKAQDKKYPIDGGVFDIASNGDVIVPIQAKIRVVDPTLFAVTVERPGGVVVSDRKHIVVTAAPG